MPDVEDTNEFFSVFTTAAAADVAEGESVETSTVSCVSGLTLAETSTGEEEDEEEMDDGTLAGMVPVEKDVDLSSDSLMEINDLDSA